MNLEVELSTPCSGDCAAAAYVMLTNINYKRIWGEHFFLSESFRTAVKECRGEVADYMSSNSIKLRIADRHDITESHFEKEIEIVRTPGKYVDVDLFFSALASKKGISIQIVISVSHSEYDNNFVVVETNVQIFNPIMDISENGRPVSAATVLTFAFADHPSNHIYATKSTLLLKNVLQSASPTALKLIMDIDKQGERSATALTITDGDDSVDKSMPLLSGAPGSQLDTNLIIIDSETLMEVETLSCDGYVDAEQFNGTRLEDNLDSCGNALAAQTTGAVTMVTKSKGVSNPNVKKDMLNFLKTSSHNVLAENLKCSRFVNGRQSRSFTCSRFTNHGMCRFSFENFSRVAEFCFGA